MSAARLALRQTRRAVVKLGTQVVTHGGTDLALGRLHGLVEDLARLHLGGVQILLVSSGSVALGLRALGHRAYPTSLGLRQACAAVGQGKLMELYTRAFEQLGVTTAQVLLTQGDLADRERALCLRTTLMRLLQLGVLPILNENDSVSVREIMDRVPEPDGEQRGFGDNDGLSARVAVAADADALLLLSNVDGLYARDPSVDPQAARVPELSADEAAARGQVVTGVSAAGTGGMASKLEAAALAARAGLPVVIADGCVPRVASRVLAGDDLGTLVTPAVRRSARRRRIAAGRAHRGALVVNDGAIEAVRARKASLLPVGVIRVEGRFERGDVVEIHDGHGRVHGRGLVNYDADACRALAGRRSDEIAQVLGIRGYDAVVTRDNLVWEDL